MQICPLQVEESQITQISSCELTGNVVLIKANHLNEYTIVTIALRLSDNCIAKQICTVPEEDAYAAMKVGYAFVI